MTPVTTPSINPVNSPSSPTASTLSAPSMITIPMTYQIFIDFGPLKTDDGLHIIKKPKYIDDCVMLTNK